MENFSKIISGWNKGNWALIITLTLALILISFWSINVDIGYREQVSQLDKEHNELQAKVELIDNILHKRDSITLNKTQHLELYDKYIYLREENADRKSEIGSIKSEWYVFRFKKFISLGAFIGLLLAYFGFSNIAEKKFIEKLAEISGEPAEDVKEIIKNKLTNKRLRKENKFLVLNKKGTGFSSNFTQIMNLFTPNLNESRLNIHDLKEALQQKNLTLIKKYQVLIIENYVEDGVWDLKFEKSVLIESKKHFNFIVGCLSLEKTELLDKLKIILNPSLSEDNKPSLPKNDLLKIFKIKEEEIQRKGIEKTIIEHLGNIREPIENNCNLIKLCNEICDTTSVVYYGKQSTGNFPSNFVDDTKNQYITFANAPATLYQNINNMLQFKHELSKKQVL